MHSVHALRWIENLEESCHDLHWFDLLDRGRFDALTNVKQHTEWKKRKLPYIKGEHFLRKKIPSLYFKIQHFLETTLEEKLEEIILKIKPDVVHSFEMQSCSYPILKTMQHYPNIKWLYSCWGSDLFFYKNEIKHRKKIKQILERIDYLHTDCKRDANIAYSLGFKGKHVGVIPGGGGFNLGKFKSVIPIISKRNVILVKGYQHKFGRALNVLKALERLTDKLIGYEVIVFAAHQPVIDYIKLKQLPYKYYSRNELTHQEVMELMSKSLIYIGNSISDGMPNTMLEAMAMGAFPIQSNPGAVTAEIIEDCKNGFLINEPDDINEILTLIVKTLDGTIDMEESRKYNMNFIYDNYNKELIHEKIINVYNNLK